MPERSRDLILEARNWNRIKKEIYLVSSLLFPATDIEAFRASEGVKVSRIQELTGFI